MGSDGAGFDFSMRDAGAKELKSSASAGGPSRALRFREDFFVTFFLGKKVRRKKECPEEKMSTASNRFLKNYCVKWDRHLAKPFLWNLPVNFKSKMSVLARQECLTHRLKAFFSNLLIVFWKDLFPNKNAPRYSHRAFSKINQASTYSPIQLPV